MTHRTLAPVLALVALASCGADQRASNAAQGGNNVDNATLAKLNLTSTAFADGRPIPVQYSCDGSNQSPPLSWSEPPHGTKSFALVIDDPDAPSGTFRHWGVYDLPPTQQALAAGAGAADNGSLKQSLNDSGKPGYTGMCPPKGHGPHHYHFRLFALDVANLELPANAKVEDIEDAARGHSLADGELIGTFERR